MKRADEDVNVWIDIAKSDLKSSILLYNLKQYRTSYYFFQQASEKTFKAMLMVYGITDKSKIRSANHDIFKLYKLLINLPERKNKKPGKTLEPSIDLNNLVSGDADKKQTLEEVEIMFKKLSNKDIFKVTHKDLEQSMNEIKRSMFYKITLPKIYGALAKRKLNKFLKWLEDKNSKKTVYAKSKLESAFNQENFVESYPFIEKMVNMWSGMSSLVYGVMICTLVTARHNNLTRYPIEEFNPLKVYRKRLPVITKQKELSSFLKKALNTLSIMASNK